MADNPRMQRFMLLATARSGSNLLSSLLSRHPSIKMYGELFNLDTIAKQDLLEALDDPVTYLRAHVYRTHRPEITAVGFKMFYEHLKKDYLQKPFDISDATERLRKKVVNFASYIETHYDWSLLSQRFRGAWDALAADRTMAVIHLQRRNILHTLISLKTAFVTGQFWTLKSNGDTRTMIRLTPDECEQYFERVSSSAAEADTLFATHRRLDVTYEELVEARESMLRRIASFLDVPYKPVTTLMQKQIAAPASEIVANYHELKHHFRHTKWHAFFD